uniref:Uncharacterized protein n=1 Tax=Anguilla anguilla TaxID=7936 RepID=A0A0E9PPA2_ANGAN
MFQTVAFGRSKVRPMSQTVSVSYHSASQWHNNRLQRQSKA